jgi:hypothetical protein
VCLFEAWSVSILRLVVPWNVWKHVLHLMLCAATFWCYVSFGSRVWSLRDVRSSVGSLPWGQRHLCDRAFAVLCGWLAFAPLRGVRDGGLGSVTHVELWLMSVAECES